MQDFNINPVAPPPRARLVIAGAALGASVIVLGGFVTMFGAVSSNPWLPDTPEAVAWSANCELATSRGARDACMRQAVLQWQAAAHQGLRLASGR